LLSANLHIRRVKEALEEKQEYKKNILDKKNELKVRCRKELRLKNKTSKKKKEKWEIKNCRINMKKLKYLIKKKKIW
jgi:hypothetical protein